MAMYTNKDKDHHRYKHGEFGTPLYKKWMAMKRRCLNKNEKSYPRYGGAGVTICKKWLDYQGFAEDMRSTFKPGLSLERIDNNKGYSKENCKWIPLNEQNKNKRNVKHYTYRGQTKTLPEWEEQFGFKKDSIRARINRQGMSFEEAIKIKKFHAHGYNKAERSH